MNIREYCLNALITIDKDEAYSNLVVKEYINKYSFTTEDKALFTNMVYGVTTHKKFLLFVLQQFIKRPHKQIFWIKNLLLMSSYQILFLDIPHFAVTSEAVKIAKKKGGASKASFINGVLRNVIRGKEAIAIPRDDKIKYLSIKYSLQEWMVEEFNNSIVDYEELEDLCASINTPLPTSLRVNTLKNTKSELQGKLDKLNLKVRQSAMVDDALVLESKVPVNKFQDLLDEGLCIIQDQSSMKVVETLQPVAGDKILDMCAAPGGKSTHMAQLMDGTGEILSCDIYSHKLQLITNLAEKLGTTNIKTKLLDGTTAAEVLAGEKFDKILLDAPCSGLGVMAGKPDIKWKKKKEDIDGLNKIQSNLLDNTTGLLKEGGVLVYSTCTITQRENGEMIKSFLLKNKDFILEEEIKLYPHKNQCHGFYIAKIRKRGEIYDKYHRIK